ncbi:respiratory nitrate reductase subunit gamma, partial [Mycobacterium tuberculosis]
MKKPELVWWRYRYDKFGWTTRSSQLYESRLLSIGSPTALLPRREIDVSMRPLFGPVWRLEPPSTPPAPVTTG